MGRFGGAFSGQRAASVTEGDCSRGDRQGCLSSLHYYFRRLTLTLKVPLIKILVIPTRSGSGRQEKRLRSGLNGN